MSTLGECSVVQISYSTCPRQFRGLLTSGSSLVNNHRAVLCSNYHLYWYNQMVYPFYKNRQEAAQLKLCHNGLFVVLLSADLFTHPSTWDQLVVVHNSTLWLLTGPTKVYRARPSSLLVSHAPGGSSKGHVWLNFSWPIRFNYPDSG